LHRHSGEGRNLDGAAEFNGEIPAFAGMTNEIQGEESPMPVNPESKLEVTAFDWVPDFARGYVRDLRPRWACEEIGLDYAEHLISAVNRPADHFLFQPWGQVPVLCDNGVRLFESGAILLHLAEK